MKRFASVVGQTQEAHRQDLSRSVEDPAAELDTTAYFMSDPAIPPPTPPKVSGLEQADDVNLIIEAELPQRASQKSPLSQTCGPMLTGRREAPREGNAGGREGRDSSGRFKSGVKAIMAARKIDSIRSEHFDNETEHQLVVAGEQGGVNFNDPPTNLLAIRCDVVVTVVDYSEGHCKTTTLNNEGIENFLKLPRPEFSKARWINVQGVDFEVMRVLAQRFKLHPLAIEDIFHTPARTKADFYDDHLFATMILVNKAKRLHRTRTSAGFHHHHNTVPRPGAKSNWHKRDSHAMTTPKISTTESHDPMYDNRAGASGLGGLIAEDDCAMERKASVAGSIAQVAPLRYRRLRHRSTMHEWLQQDQLSIIQDLEIEIEQANFFLLQDNTVISIFSHEGIELTDPIHTRIKQTGTMIRELEDVSYVLYTLVDGVVDHYLVLADMYNSVIDRLEEKIMKQPKAVYTKTLHLLAKEVRAFKRLLDPTNALISALRASTDELDPHGRLKHRVALSKTSRVYLSDVHDHINSVLENLEGLRDEANDLIGFIFNVTSHSTNESMKLLAIFSVFFLPVTFLAGVYGMNFEYFPEVKGTKAEVPDGVGLLGSFWWFWIWVGVSLILSTGFLYLSRIWNPYASVRALRHNKRKFY
ncbi:hypothetical protein BJ742DRAFT_822037 [Cladochytrium replicatum]|nr:hypothetical protein BJ742DRAFT_822037 [Cladochytrium replicatum]